MLTGVTGQTLAAGLHKGLVFTGDWYQGITRWTRAGALVGTWSQSAGSTPLTVRQPA